MDERNNLDEVITGLHKCAHESSDDINDRRNQLRYLLQNLYCEQSKKISLSETIETITSNKDKNILSNRGQTTFF